MFRAGHAQTPQLTTINDVVYRGNGAPAQGSVVISWPAFSTADQRAVAAGEIALPIATGGVLSVNLAPNEGATPSGSYYKVVYKLSDGTTSTEYWVVPATSPTTIAAIRSSVVPRTMAAQLVTRQYVDNVLQGNDVTLVHRAGSEAISGVKAFTVSPTVPTPTSSTAVANKSYVDAAVTAVSAGYLNKSGDTMLGRPPA
jgi:trimeric autotransporter adhesin